ncbi:M4 family metallopeptidase [Streptomyces sp. NPDC088350]|uniref:M4 family metallopeptidase n=1 Tax=Streptomyces sp. NPDC088350 TaxID=3365854 RepID=UPI00382B8939
MDSTLLATLIGTAGGALATAGGAWLRTRNRLRTAARLIYAELTRDSAAVAYFRQTGHWVAPTLSRAAWDSQGAVLARRRDVRVFETVHRGYEALELLPFLADDALSPAARDRWLAGEVEQIAAAIERIGALAQVSREQIVAWTRRLRRGRPGAGYAADPLMTSGVVPPLALLERLTREEALALDFGGGPGVTLKDGGLRLRRPADQVAAHVVFDAAGGDTLDRLRPVRYTGLPPTGDPAVDEAYDGMVAASTFLSEVFGRATISGRNGPLAAVVHYDVAYNNAFWNGELMVFGDGDQERFGRFTQCLDVVVVEAVAGLPELAWTFHGQSGALTLSVRDVLAQLARQYKLGQSADEADWLVAGGLVVPSAGGQALRSLKAPGTAYDNELLGRDPQPDHMRGYVETEADNGGVHLNSGIPGHAFYLLAAALGGRAWERAGRVWWDALTSGEAMETPTFEDWARRTAHAAVARYGEDGEEHRAVLAAWDSVGLPVGDQDRP